MTLQVQLPPLLRALCGGARMVTAEGETIAAALGDVARKHPSLGLHLFDEAGFIRPTIVFLHGNVLVRAGEAAEHRVKSGDEIVLTNALSGG